MGRGQRHSKNAGVMGSEGLSYAEKRALGYGTVKERFGKEALGHYYDCCLTLTEAVDPVITPDGYLFSREAILENLLAQKKGLKKRMAAWEAAQQGAAKKDLHVTIVTVTVNLTITVCDPDCVLVRAVTQVADSDAVAKQAALVAFDRANHMGISQKTADAVKGAIVESAAAATKPQTASNVIAIKEQEERAKTSKASLSASSQRAPGWRGRGGGGGGGLPNPRVWMQAFWMPGSVPDAEVVVEKPSNDTLCPACNKPLKLKDLVPVRFTKVPGDKEGRHMDPVTKDIFTAATKLVALRPTGDVVALDTWTKVLRPEGEFKGVWQLRAVTTIITLTLVILLIIIIIITIVIIITTWHVSNMAMLQTQRHQQQRSQQLGATHGPYCCLCCGGWSGHQLTDKDVIELKTGGTGFCARDGDKVVSEKWVRVTPQPAWPCLAAAAPGLA
ncbi:hypothetical protein QJQ45_020734 [Haematococcus lacustris]|nr:hypothetical protein QJQ45_020734 [Haematococcus lacustris]